MKRRYNQYGTFVVVVIVCSLNTREHPYRLDDIMSLRPHTHSSLISTVNSKDRVEILSKKEAVILAQHRSGHNSVL